MKTSKRNKLLLAGLAVVVLAFVAVNYGGSLAKRVTEGRATIVSVTVPQEGADILVDSRRMGRTEGKDSTTNLHLEPGKRVIIVAKEGYWPWSKTIELAKGAKPKYASFHVPMENGRVEVRPGTDEYAAAVEKLRRLRLPNADDRFFSRDREVDLYVDGDSVIAEASSTKNPPAAFCDAKGACTPSKAVINAAAPVTSVAFYRDRSDVVLFSSGGKIFAIEINSDGTQNFQPVFEGKSPVFVPADGDFIYVRDQGKIFKVLM